MRAKKLFSILLAMMLMLFALFPIQAGLPKRPISPHKPPVPQSRLQALRYPPSGLTRPRPGRALNPVWKHLWTCRGSWVFLFSSMG